MVKAIAGQLDRCEICGRKEYRSNLVRTNVDFLAAGGNNYIPYSSYSATGWTTSGLTSQGDISIGPYADRARVVIGDDNTRTEAFGSQTWSGDGHLYTATPVDVSSWTSFVLAADVGPYHRSTARSLTVVLQTCQSDGTVDDILSTWRIGHDCRVWGYTPIAGLSVNTSSAYFRIDVTPETGQYWWVDRIQLIKNATSINGQAFIPTTGASVDRVDTPMMTVRVVCPSCFERPRLRTEQRNREYEQRVEDPIPVEIQEV
jgi:hypothetical protein